ncbi:hypothetical protein NE237_028980 [Protea cynaroides]|uniref:Uncharacterized protein n=1 Tax=Protea cynaroides TaxID=273540 RepID=A0A9Q0GT29_9MAGN|nr:hypothetical protein NE237_028980 [Protea cynaroides]
MRHTELAKDILKASTTQQLPPMLENLNICKGCCHLNVCTIYHKAPRFDIAGICSQDPAISYVSAEKNLNKNQHRATHKILTAKDYALILGMAGIGKTSTMGACCEGIVDERFYCTHWKV